MSTIDYTELTEILAALNSSWEDLLHDAVEYGEYPEVCATEEEREALVEICQEELAEELVAEAEAWRAASVRREGGYLTCDIEDEWANPVFGVELLEGEDGALTTWGDCIGQWCSDSIAARRYMDAGVDIASAVFDAVSRGV